MKIEGFINETFTCWIFRCRLSLHPFFSPSWFHELTLHNVILTIILTAKTFSPRLSCYAVKLSVIMFINYHVTRTWCYALHSFFNLNVGGGVRGVGWGGLGLGVGWCDNNVLTAPIMLSFWTSSAHFHNLSRNALLILRSSLFFLNLNIFLMVRAGISYVYVNTRLMFFCWLSDVSVNTLQMVRCWLSYVYVSTLLMVRCWRSYVYVNTLLAVALHQCV